MCELMGMSANVPTDICFSFAGLRIRGGATGPHKDGWGMAMYRENSVWSLHDPRPSSESDLAVLMSTASLKCDIAITHIRQANVGEVSLANTHPFHRQLWGKTWSYAHNGQLSNSENLTVQQSVMGTTDSERAFCWLLEQLKDTFGEKEPNVNTLSQKLHSLANELREKGVFNMLLSDGQTLFCYCSTHLHWLTRRAPFNVAKLKDTPLDIDFEKVTSETDVVTIIATQPLTDNEKWQQMEAGELVVFQAGEVIESITCTE
ncbi:class II glutamine amidotransferase [Marinomonas agarivorans]|nr:class II glutamine amidotransferase [Marinomonas agarivorans]